MATAKMATPMPCTRRCSILLAGGCGTLEEAIRTLCDREPHLCRTHYRVLCAVILWAHALLSDAFDVVVPKTPSVGIHGQSVVLGCGFAVIDGFSLEHIVITWQRTRDNKVVHSYHYGKDQHDKQDRQYSGRTSLFTEELRNGNISLKLDKLRVEDAGQYMCFVSSVIGSAKGTVSLEIAAYYSEPDVLVKFQSSGTSFILTSRGYPEASVSWHCEDNNKHLKPDVSFSKTEDGLYSLKSILEVAQVSMCNKFVAEIQNHLVNQTIIRRFNRPLADSGENKQAVTFMNVCIAMGLFLLAFGTIITLYLVKREKQLRRINDELTVMNI
ncbi:CD276 antigen-like [Hypanus sabinus]|uniref:CD276 antigen-like n=1 Tax=Hypanus sabinus TaxID=79690 RepID=UPI0028C4A828|nr:CD276 antigen-like [Hypanus sabinus]